MIVMKSNLELVKNRQECVDKLYARLSELQTQLVDTEFGRFYIVDVDEKEIERIATILFCFGYRQQYELFKKTKELKKGSERNDALITVCEAFLVAMKKEVTPIDYTLL